MRSVALAMVLSTGAVCWVAPAHAGDVQVASEADKHSARKLVESGDEKYRNGDYEGALSDYRGADTIMGVPTTSIEVARALAALGRLLEARVSYEQIIAFPKEPGEPSAFSQAREKARAGLSELLLRTPLVTVVLAMPKDAHGQVKVTIDGIAVSPDTKHPLNPGEHVLEAAAPGFRSSRQSFSLVEGDRQALTVQLQRVPAPAPPPSPPPPLPSPEPVPEEEATIPAWTWVGVAFATAGVAVGAVTGGLSLTKAADFRDQDLGNNLYPESARSLQEESVTLAHVSTVSFAVAGAGLVLAVAGFIVYAATGDESSAVDRGMWTVSF